MVILTYNARRFNHIAAYHRFKQEKFPKGFALHRNMIKLICFWSCQALDLFSEPFSRYAL